MSRPTNEQYREAARAAIAAALQRDRDTLAEPALPADLSVPLHGDVSRAASGGAYVEVTLWVRDDEVQR